MNPWTRRLLACALLSEQCRKLSCPVRIKNVTGHCHCHRKEVRHIMQEMSHTSLNEYSQSSKVSPKDFTDFLWWCLIILTRFYARTFCKILLMFKLYTSIKNSFNTAFFTKAIIEEKIHFSISFIFCFQSFKINLYLAVKINQT